MLNAIRQRREDEKGFTLIELMVVVLIIAILIAIAIPTFLGAQDRARDRGAQSDLRNALTAARTIATDYEGFFKKASGACTASTDVDASALKAEEAALDFIDTLEAADTSADITDVGVETSSDCTTIGLARQSASGTLFALKASQTGTVTYCKDTEAKAFNDPSGTCDDESW